MSQCSETDSQVHTLSLASLLVMFSCSVMSDSLWLHGLQLTRLPCLSLSPRVCSDSCPLSRWCHSTISSSVVPFSSCLTSFPASGSFPVSWLFPSGGQSIGVSALASVLPMNNQGWFLLGLTGLISWQAVQGILKSLLQHRSLKGSISSASFLFQFFNSVLWKLQSCFILMLIFRVCVSQKQSVQYQDMPESSILLDTFLSSYC